LALYEQSIPAPKNGNTVFKWEITIDVILAPNQTAGKVNMTVC